MPQRGPRREARAQRGRPPVQPAEAPRRAAPPRPHGAGLDPRRRVRRLGHLGRRRPRLHPPRARRPAARCSPCASTAWRAWPSIPRSPTRRSSTSWPGRIRVIACLDERADRVLAARCSRSSRAGTWCSTASASAPASARTTMSSSCSARRRTCRTAADEIRLRFADATVGVPKETRQALVGGYTTFERILPGPDRMYPDTDSPPTRVTEERVAGHQGRPQARRRGSASSATGPGGVPEETTQYLIRRGGAEIVDAVVAKTGVDGLTAAIMIGQRAKALTRAGIPDRAPRRGRVGRGVRPLHRRPHSARGRARRRDAAWRRTACGRRGRRGRGHRARRAARRGSASSSGLDDGRLPAPAGRDSHGQAPAVPCRPRHGAAQGPGARRRTWPPTWRGTLEEVAR